MASSRWLPLVLLAVLSVFSLGARTLWLDRPDGPVFDEVYYVDAARAILGWPHPPRSPYALAPPGLDPNTEHPPLAKLAIAGGMLVFGDHPWGWRMGSIVFGTGAILAMYGLVRSARGSSWLALGAAALMAFDNLFVVHGRIGTLDIFVLVFMLVGVALYLRNRPWLAGMVLGIGACAKLVALYALLVIVLLEVLSLRGPRPQSLVDEHPSDEHPAKEHPVGTSAARLARCSAALLVSYLALLLVLDVAVTPYSEPLSHTSYMYGYASGLKSLPIAPGSQLAPPSSAWQWPLNRTPIDYYRGGVIGATGKQRPAHFQGRMTPFIIYLAVPAMALVLAAAWRTWDQPSILAAAWTLGTFLPFLAMSFANRYNYIFYMLIVLPGVYLAVARMFSGRYLPRFATVLYAGLVVYGFSVLYPFRVHL